MRLSARKTLSSRFSREDVVLLAVLLLYMLVLQVPWSPPNEQVEADVTIYAYGGQEILRGGLPYRDFWDHKGPATYYVFAAAFWLAGADAWGVWYLAVFWAALIAVSFYMFLRTLMLRRYAFAGSVLFLSILLQDGYYQGATTPEFLGVLPAIGSLLLTASFFMRPERTKVIWLGLMFAAGASFKMSNVGMATACLLAILAHEARRGGLRASARTLGMFAVSPLAVVILLAAYWAMQGALTDLWQATVVYNFLYVEGGGFGLGSLYATVRRFASDPSLLVLTAFSGGTILALWRGRGHWHSTKSAASGKVATDANSLWWTYAAVVAALPLEILLIASSGRNYGHYYQSAFPALAASASYWLRLGGQRSVDSADESGLRLVTADLVWGALLVWTLAMVGLVRPTSSQLRAFWREAPLRSPRTTETGRFIVANTEPSDSVLVWSTNAEFNFETGRRAPTSYVFIHPIFQEGFQNSRSWDQFLGDLESHPPALIIADTRPEFAPDFSLPEDQLAEACECEGEILEGFRAFSQFVKANYRATQTFAQYLVVYVPIDH